MKIVSRVTIGLGLLLGSGIGAMANIAWTPNEVDDFTVPQTFDAFIPGTIGTANKGVSEYTDPYSFSDSATTGKKTGSSLTSDHIASVADLVATPEPSGLPLLGAGAILIAMLVRRKLRVS